MGTETTNTERTHKNKQNQAKIKREAAIQNKTRKYVKLHNKN
jgi:hypothetical protein